MKFGSQKTRRIPLSYFVVSKHAFDRHYQRDRQMDGQLALTELDMCKKFKNFFAKKTEVNSA